MRIPKLNIPRQLIGCGSFSGITPMMTANVVLQLQGRRVSSVPDAGTVTAALSAARAC
jgi:hypothetical protein